MKKKQFFYTKSMTEFGWMWLCFARYSYRGFRAPMKTDIKIHSPTCPDWFIWNLIGDSLRWRQPAFIPCEMFIPMARVLGMISSVTGMIDPNPPSLQSFVTFKILIPIATVLGMISSIIGMIIWEIGMISPIIPSIPVLITGLLLLVVVEFRSVLVIMSATRSHNH